MNPLLALTVTAALAGPAAPAPPTFRTAPLFDIHALPVETIGTPRNEVTATAAVRALKGDSVKNGAIIGAVVAGVGWGGFVYALCNALDETEGNEDCVKGALAWTAIAAAGGAALGAGIDAMIDRSPVPAAGRKPIFKSPKPALKLTVRF